MHYHCEVVLPPDTEDVEAAVASVLKQFDENVEESDDYDTTHSFWDWYVIGGRWAGSKLLARYDQSKVAEFRQWLTDEGVTVSGLQCGKPELSPKEQIAKVDAKWNAMFPSADGTTAPCPIFSHSNDQYGRNGDGTIAGDICKLGDAKSVKCSRVIFAGPSYDSDSKERTGPLRATYMLCDTAWNGVNHMAITWDGTVGGALAEFVQGLEGYADAYREQMTPTDHWITVTVDYHS